LISLTMWLEIIAMVPPLVLLAFCGRRILLLLAALMRPRVDRPVTEGALPSLSILVPAHNEEASCGRLLASLDELEYPSERLSIVLISDGSTDGTAACFAKWAKGRARTRVLIGPHRGKAWALNHGLEISSSDLIAVCDADLSLRPDSMRHLAAAFADRTVAAAAAMLRPENDTRSPVARYAAVEAWVNQLVTSAGRDRLDANPPALGASVYRQTALKQVGGFPVVADGEDIALTVALTRAGWRTRFIAEAVADNCVVERLADYWQQHVRWFRGSMSAAPAPRATRHHPLLRRVEAWMLKASYADRLLFVTVAGLGVVGGATLWVPALYVIVRVVEVVVALAKGGAGRQAPKHFLWTSVFVMVDVIASIVGAGLHLARRPRSWRSPRPRELRSG
jgi:cellulose synthase/poly-beta-1,6-N-acetylglucosamine synthase-like glycosyltransferase